ncbi:hypothetical protein ACNOYE_26160 [Nannocystaceae bacterium ST9]
MTVTLVRSSTPSRTAGTVGAPVVRVFAGSPSASGVVGAGAQSSIAANSVLSPDLAGLQRAGAGQRLGRERRQGRDLAAVAIEAGAVDHVDAVLELEAPALAGVERGREPGLGRGVEVGDELVLVEIDVWRGQVERVGVFVGEHAERGAFGLGLVASRQAEPEQTRGDPQCGVTWCWFAHDMTSMPARVDSIMAIVGSRRSSLRAVEPASTILACTSVPSPSPCAC